MKNQRRTFCALVLGVSVFPFLLVASQSLSITGRVVDSHGELVAGARIFMTSDAGGYRTTNSSGNGEFALGQLVPGEYRLRVESPGFAPSTESVSLTTEDVSVTIILRPSESRKAELLHR